MEQQNVHLKIVGIKQVAFEIDESIESLDTTMIGINFEQAMNINIKESKMELILTFRFFIQGKPEKDFLKIKTSNSFFIQELKSFLTDKENIYNFPDTLLATVLGLSISHTLALLAQCTQGTKFDGFYIPMFNPNELAKNYLQIILNNLERNRTLDRNRIE